MSISSEEPKPSKEERRRKIIKFYISDFFMQAKRWFKQNKQYNALQKFMAIRIMNQIEQELLTYSYEQLLTLREQLSEILPIVIDDEKFNELIERELPSKFPTLDLSLLKSLPDSTIRFARNLIYNFGNALMDCIDDIETDMEIQGLE
jgi:hypothetical protein